MNNVCKTILQETLDLILVMA